MFLSMYLYLPVILIYNIYTYIVGHLSADGAVSLSSCQGSVPAAVPREAAAEIHGEGHKFRLLGFFAIWSNLV